MPKTTFLASLQARLNTMGGRGMPQTTEAFKTGVREIEATWKSVANGAPLNGEVLVKNPSGGYAAGVKVRQVGPFDYTVYNDSKGAEGIENGTPPLDMKQTHPYGPKGRVANKGTKTNPRWVPYLIVPFRWGTPGASGGHFRNIIPNQIYSMLRMQIRAGQFIRTQVASETHSEPNFWGEAVQRAQYQGENGREGWGSMLRGIGGNIEGLSAMDADTRKKKKGSAYFTFRVISADSPAGSWIKPATPAKNVAKKVADYTRDIITEMVEAAIKADLGLS
ncbi:MAG: hypothetical protein ACOYM2_21730 [Rectinemataceae bacterium]